MKTTSEPCLMHSLSLEFSAFMFQVFGIYVFDIKYNLLADDTYFKGNNNFGCLDDVRLFTESLI